ncbi:hypothetical protein PVAP13_7KG321303 [Panicum virgatum]|uniref:Uncharacterized protein n=1 Tax=Panicum virgatum TaxID=38727 RepID=A0A8T0QJC1_PANVG|nr:hypothetical protein PVAP13_7KG321303 [Panicum virgatum]
MDREPGTVVRVLRQPRRRGRRSGNGSRGGRWSSSTSCSSSPGRAWPRSSAGSTTTRAARACGCRRWCSPTARRSPSRCCSTSGPPGSPPPHPPWRRLPGRRSPSSPPSTPAWASSSPATT